MRDFAGSCTDQRPPLLLIATRRDEYRGVSSDDLLGHIAGERLGALVPAENGAIRSDAGDGVLGRFHNRCQQVASVSCATCLSTPGNGGFRGGGQCSKIGFV